MFTFLCREIGSDIAKGETILKAGLCLGPAEVGLLATMGITQVECFAKPGVGVMSTGTEVLCIHTRTVTSCFELLTSVVFSQLVEPHEKPLPGQIRDANRATLSTLVSDAGFPVADVGIAADTYVLKSRVHILFMTKCQPFFMAMFQTGSACRTTGKRLANV